MLSLLFCSIFCLKLSMHSCYLYDTQVNLSDVVHFYDGTYSRASKLYRPNSVVRKANSLPIFKPNNLSEYGISTRLLKATPRKRNHPVHSEGPHFTEPYKTFGLDSKRNVDYYNSTGVVLKCKARGNPSPTIKWISGSESDFPASGTVATDVEGFRYMRDDGSLVILPFAPDQFQQSVHSTLYWCKASNIAGSVLGAPTRVRAVMKQDYVLESSDEFTMVGSTALMACTVPAMFRDMVRVVYWQRSDGSIITSDSRTSSLDSLHLLDDGSLLIERVRSEDIRWKYRCAGKDLVTGELITSLNWSKLVLTDRKSPPQIIGSLKDSWIEIGQDLRIGCTAQSNPAPSFHWVKSDEGKLNLNHTPIKSEKPMLFIPKIQLHDSGTYICVVNNSHGQAKASIKVNVYEPITAVIRPTSSMIRRKEGDSAVIECIVKMDADHHHLLSFEWLKDGHSLIFGSRIKQITRSKLKISPLIREDKGMYQCLVINTGIIRDIAIASTQIYIEEEAPSLRYTFQSQILEEGSSVSLKCAASGSPLPQIRWKLYDKLLDGRDHRYNLRVGDFVDNSGLIVSFLNVSSITRREGGRYTCEAKNAIASSSYSALVSVIGRPMVHAMDNVTVVLNGRVSLQCPVSGHPIETVTWKKNSRTLPVSRRTQSFPNGTLAMVEAHSDDEGWYQCEVNTGQEFASESLYIRVLEKPVINPFVFGVDITEGMKARVVCSILSGDHPLTISWLKNGLPVNQVHPEIEISSFTESDSSLLIRKVKRVHSGNYTCVAASSHVWSNFTAEMIVKASPRWIIKPLDNYSLLKARTIIIDCQTDGYPPPTHQWKKLRKSSSASNHPPELVSIVSGPHIQVLENGSMAIVEVDKSDEGEYVCEANNGIWPSLSTTTKLKVHRPVQFRKNFEIIQANRYEDVTLVCEANGDRPIQVTWIRDREAMAPIADNGRFRIDEKPMENGLLSKVTIESVQVSDSAFFACQGRNSHGTDERNIQLIVRGPPESPENLHVELVKSRELSVSWSEPLDGNNPLTGYLVQYAPFNASWSDSQETITVTPKDLSAIISDLIPKTSYRVQVIAQNALGQSKPTQPILVTTEEEAPSLPPSNIQIDSLSGRSIKVTWDHVAKSQRVQGYHIGFRRVDSYTTLADAFTFRTLGLNETSKTLHRIEYMIDDLKRKTKYGVVVQAYNQKGPGKLSEEVFGQTLEYDPPEHVKIKVTNVKHHSLVLSIENPFPENPITGYLVNYKSNLEEWEEQKVLGNRKNILLENLRCGTKYTLSVTPYNNAGKSSKSQVIHSSTTGSVPSAGPSTSLLTVNSTYALIHLSAWSENGCPIVSFVVQYKEHLHGDWIILSNNVLPSQGTVLISDLTPGTWYDLLMIANSEAGPTEAQYLFATLTVTGATVPPISSRSYSNWELTLSDPIVLAPIVSAFLVLIVILITVAVLITSKDRRQEISQPTYDCPGRQKMESVSMSSFRIANNTATEGKKIYEMLHREPGYGSYYTSPYPSKRLPLCEVENLS